MKQLIRKSIFAIILSTTPFFLFAKDGDEKLSRTDGPYIFHKEERVQIIRVSEQGVSVENDVNPNVPFWVHSQDEKHRFEVTFHPVVRPEWNSKRTGDIMVISDPHGNMDAFLSILKSQKVIDDNYRWVFGKNHLVIIGDVFDRGEDVLPLFWLIYKLEAEAAETGGKVHFLLGNHEEMILRNNVKYAQDKYKNLATELKINYSDMWTHDSELGHWLLTRNTMELIGSNLFVHAGLSKDFLDQNWAIPQLNDSVSKYVHMVKEERIKTESGRFLFGNQGPLWYRGMVLSDSTYTPIREPDVDLIMKKYNAKQIFVGHTIFPEVSSFYNGKVIGVNVNNQKNMDAGTSRGIWMQKDNKYLIYDDPTKNKLLISNSNQ